MGHFLGFAVDFDGGSQEEGRAFSVPVDVPGEAVIVNIHLSQAGQDGLGAGVEIGSDEILPLLHQCLCFVTGGVQMADFAKCLQNGGAFALQQLPLGIVIVCGLFFLLGVGLGCAPTLLRFLGILFLCVLQFGGVKFLETHIVISLQCLVDQADQTIDVGLLL